MNINSIITKDYRKKGDFAVRKNKANSNPVLSAVEWANFRQEMLKNALSTCLRKAPLRQHRQSYATWNLLYYH